MKHPTISLTAILNKRKKLEELQQDKSHEGRASELAREGDLLHKNRSLSDALKQHLASNSMVSTNTQTDENVTHIDYDKEKELYNKMSEDEKRRFDFAKALKRKK